MNGDSPACADWRAVLLSSGNPLPVLACAGGRIQTSNRAACALFGEILGGAEVRSLFHRDSRAKLDALLLRPDFAGAIELMIARGNELPRATQFLLLPDPPRGNLLVACTTGSERADEASANLLEANDRLVGLARSLSRTVRDAHAEREALSQLGNLRELFVTAMAHDLRSPLQAIILSEALLKDSEDAGERRDALHRHAGRVEGQAQRMLALIDSLLVTARLDATEPGLPTEPLDLCGVAKDMVDAFEPQAQLAQTQIELACASDACVRGNRVWLGEVFANLLSNALRHSPRTSRVAIAIRREDDRIISGVCDQGAGVPDAERESVFERYAQYGAHKGAAGLGLYICRRVVELHGGRIWVEAAPSPDRGARFAFELPALDPHPAG